MVLSIVSIIILTSIVVYSADAAGIPKKAISTVARFLESDLPTTTVFTDVANTFGAGQKQTFQNSATTSGLNLSPSTDPSTLSNGDLWLSSTTANTLKYRAGGTTFSIDLVPTVQQNKPTGTFAIGGTTNTYFMAGTGVTFTPQTTGTIIYTISGTESSSTTTASTGIIQIAFGTGTAPTNAAAATGTVVTNTNPLGPMQAISSATPLPFSYTAIITGLTPGTTYWIDPQIQGASTTAKFTLRTLSVSIRET